jgi:hypothetical protein
VIVTTSWDDGHPADERVLDMLAERGLRGTFYIASAPDVWHSECRAGPQAA